MFIPVLDYYFSWLKSLPKKAKYILFLEPTEFIITLSAFKSHENYTFYIPGVLCDKLFKLT